ncbi:hypothetical protein CHS0354_026759 [Potamilus streckersoni]|uniref:Uncharacterized protein n=1 Tax=Potamilus streckersoni TaxID=2493646 RepID=A0AAE0SAW1_9BIVA|nr:hypothetical protein CHS0354_026759 [Potamilus streckersoni]
MAYQEISFTVKNTFSMRNDEVKMHNVFMKEVGEKVLGYKKAGTNEEHYTELLAVEADQARILQDIQTAQISKNLNLDYGASLHLPLNSTAAIVFPLRGKNYQGWIEQFHKTPKKMSLV